MRDLKVILVGPMGAGKSTIGRILAAQLGWPYIDNDEELRTLNSMALADIEKLPVSDLHQSCCNLGKWMTSITGMTR